MSFRGLATGRSRHSRGGRARFDSGRSADLRQLRPRNPAEPPDDSFARSNAVLFLLPLTDFPRCVRRLRQLQRIDFVGLLPAMDPALKSPRPRLALIVTALAPVVPQLLGSAFNIWYNLAVVEPLLGTEALKARFLQTCIIYNAVVYPVALFLWLRQVFSLGPVVRMLGAGGKPEAAALMKARRGTINLPWSITAISGAAWLLCVPVFLITLGAASGSLDRQLLWHLPISVSVSASSPSLTVSFGRTRESLGLFPVLFRDARADLTREAGALAARARPALGDFRGICRLAHSSPELRTARPGTDPAWFAVFVGTVGVAFGLAPR